MSLPKRLHRWRSDRVDELVRSRIAAHSASDFDHGDHVRLRVRGEPLSVGVVIATARDTVLVSFPDGDRALTPAQLEIL